MAKGGFSLDWRLPPMDAFGNRFADASRQAPSIISGKAAQYTETGEARMQADAPWTDRTGEARASLYGRATRDGFELGGDSDHNIYLEVGTSKMAARPIIKPTLDELASEFFEDAVNAVMETL